MKTWRLTLGDGSGGAPRAELFRESGQGAGRTWSSLVAATGPLPGWGTRNPATAAAAATQTLASPALLYAAVRSAELARLCRAVDGWVGGDLLAALHEERGRHAGGLLLVESEDRQLLALPWELLGSSAGPRGPLPLFFPSGGGSGWRVARLLPPGTLREEARAASPASFRLKVQFSFPTDARGINPAPIAADLRRSTFGALSRVSCEVEDVRAFWQDFESWGRDPDALLCFFGHCETLDDGRRRLLFVRPGDRWYGSDPIAPDDFAAALRVLSCPMLVLCACGSTAYLADVLERARLLDPCSSERTSVRSFVGFHFALPTYLATAWLITLKRSLQHTGDGLRALGAGAAELADVCRQSPVLDSFPFWAAPALFVSRRTAESCPEPAELAPVVASQEVLGPAQFRPGLTKAHQDGLLRALETQELVGGTKRGLLGRIEEAPLCDELPEVSVPRLAMDRYPVTRFQLYAVLRGTDPDLDLGVACPAPEEDLLPAVLLPDSFEEILDAYLRLTGKRLPTPDEWEYAVRRGAPSQLLPGCRSVGELGDFVTRHAVVHPRRAGTSPALEVTAYAEQQIAAFGLADMLGNAPELTQTSDGTYYVVGGRPPMLPVETLPQLRHILDRRPGSPGFGFRGVRELD